MNLNHIIHNRMKKLLFLGIAILFLISCDKKDTDYQIKQLNEFGFNYLNEIPLNQANYYKDDFFLYNDTLVQINYDNSRPVEFNGGLISMPITSGYSKQTTSLIYKTVEYTNSTTIITENVRPNELGLNATSTGKSQLFYENDVLKLRINENVKDWTYDNDTIYYSYDINDRIYEAIVFQDNIKTVNKFIFDSKDNLQRVNFETYRISDSEMIGEGFHEFSDFDSADNLFSNLGIFNNLFFRSLSKNNYRKYHFEKKNYGSTSDSNSFPTYVQNYVRTIEWTIDYDEKGLPLYRN